jgi:glycosyltransferase involved in cell wall biosynthesis
LRLAVVSPFLDRHHATEHVILEQLERFSEHPETEIHVYAHRLEDLTGVSRFHSRKKQSGRILWHKIPSLPGPHLFAYIWWFFANHFYRWRDSRFRALTYDLVYSPGINALDADVIAVHIVFHEFYRRIRPHLSLAASSASSWPRLIHRRLYYRLIMALERRVYRRPGTQLVAVSRLVSRHLEEFFQRSDACVVPNAVDTARFAPRIRVQRRETVRGELRLSPDIFALLMIGNDWAKKGLEALLQCLAECRNLPLTLLVVGRDDRGIFLPLVDRFSLQQRVQFHPSTDDIEQFYAAADLYAGPSLEDSFAMPPLEAMACGLPVITSVNNGGSQIITEGVDGFVLPDPRDVTALSSLVRRLYADPDLRLRVGENAARTAQSYTWDRNARETWDFLIATLAKKRQAAASSGNKRRQVP